MSNVKNRKKTISRRRVYLDYASTTPLDPRVLNLMLPYLRGNFGNPSSIHAEGVAAKKALCAARKKTAAILSVRAERLVFTSGGTESNNLAISGVVRALEKQGRAVSSMHFITTLIEHSSVLECFRELISRGAKVSYAPVAEDGIVEARALARLLRSETVLVSVGYANNEIGAIQPIAKIAQEIRDFRNQKSKIPNSKSQENSKSQFPKFQMPFFHTDASQAPLFLDCSPERLGVDLLTLDGHKMYGPKGVGALYVRRGTPLAPQILGGGQEGGARSTTENVAGIVGFAAAFEIAAAGREKESARLKKLRDYFHSDVLKNIRIRRKVVVNGSLDKRLPNNINLSLPGVDTEMLALRLDAAGIACSTKSSCLRDEAASYVVAALGGGSARANSTLRFSFGRATTKKDVEYLMAELFRLVR